MHEYLDRLAMASFFIVGVVTAWSGFNYPMMYFNAEFISFEPYHVTKLILSFCLLVMALIMLKSHHMSTAILSSLIGLSTITFSISELFYHIYGDTTMDLVFSFPIIAIAIFKFYQGKRYRGTAIGLLGVSMLILSVFSGSTFSLIGGVGLVISGFMMMLLGIIGLVRNERTMPTEKRDYGYEMVSIAGFMFVSLYCVISSLDIYDYPYYMVSFLLSLSITFIAVWGLMDGILIEGLVQFMYGFSSMIFAVDRLLGGQGYVITDLGFALIIGICGVMLLMRRQYTLAIPCILFGVLIIPGSAFEQGFMWGVASLAMLPFFAYYSISRWLYRDLGKEILPITE